MNTSLFSDFRLAARLLLKDKWFTLAAVAALALGIAANNTIFTIVNGMLLRDLPFDEPDRIVALGLLDTARRDDSAIGLSYADFRDWQAGVTRFDGIAAFSEEAMNVSEEGVAPERFQGAFISADAFRLIGARPVIGREIRVEDDREGAAPVVIIGHDVWRTRYQASPDVIGRAIRVNGVASTVIGVMPEGFLFPQRSFLWRPLAALDEEGRRDRDSRYLGALGRLKEGVSREQATADLSAVTLSLAAQYPATNRSLVPRVTTFRSGIGGPVRGLLATMMSAVVFVLLIACANVANLLLSRASTRVREVSVRMSIGASRWRVVRQLLMESLLLALIAGAVGLALSVAGVRAFWTSASQSSPPYWLQFPMDWRVFTFLTVICLGTAILFGLVPALHTSNTNLVEALSDAGRGSSSGRQTRRWTGALVIGQMALAVVLLTGAGLQVRNLLVLATMEAGVDTSSLVRLRFELPSPAYDAPERRLALYRQFEDRIASAPGLRAALANAVPLFGGASREVAIAGQPDPTPSTRPRATMVTVGKNYFDVLGARVSRGRVFVDGDGTPGRGAAIVNERFADVHFRSADAIGQRLRFPDDEQGNGGASEWLTIVGVVQNVRQRPPNDGGFDTVVYVPFAWNATYGMQVLVRMPSDPVLAMSTLRPHLDALDKDLPFFDVRTVDDYVYSQRWSNRIVGSMFGAFGAIALVLATVGLYAVTAYSVAQRTREIGVRLALGAQSHHVWWLVTRRASWQIAIGLIPGLAGAVAVSRLLPSQITRSAGDDLAIVIAVTALLVIVALLACLIPGSRAMRLNPVEALRSE